MWDFNMMSGFERSQILPNLQGLLTGSEEASHADLGRRQETVPHRRKDKEAGRDGDFHFSCFALPRFEDHFRNLPENLSGVI